MNTSADVHTLTGAYALNALSPQERERFEQHLNECSSCAEEVAEFGEVTTRLATAAAEQPPPELREQVLAAVANTRQLPPEVAEAPPDSGVHKFGRPQGRWWRRFSAVAAAAAIVAAVVLGYQAVVTSQQLDELRRADDAYTALTDLLGTSDVRVITRTTESGATTTAVVSYDRGVAMVMASGLATPPEGRVYQAWVIDADGPKSAGLMPSAERSYTQLIARGVDPGDKLGLTIEPEGGSSQPTSPTVVAIPL